MSISRPGAGRRSAATSWFRSNGKKADEWRRRRQRSKAATAQWRSRMAAEHSQQVEQAIAKVKSLRDGDLGVVDAVACGDQAVPSLRAMLFERERSGLYQARRRAVEALAALGAHHVLTEFLEGERAIADPVERVGEDVVVDAAALALANLGGPHAFDLLLRLARRRSTPGVISALGAFRDVEAIPALIEALKEDASRPAAKAALRKLGLATHPALLRAVGATPPPGERESESNARRRRCALRLLTEIDGSRAVWRDLRPFARDEDATVAALACAIGLSRAPAAERLGVARRLIELLAKDDSLLRDEIERCLVARFGSARDAIAQRLAEIPQPGEDGVERMRVEASLRRVVAQAQSSPKARPRRLRNPVDPIEPRRR